MELFSLPAAAHAWAGPILNAELVSPMKGAGGQEHVHLLKASQLLMRYSPCGPNLCYVTPSPLRVGAVTAHAPLAPTAGGIG